MTSDLINYVGRYGGFCRDCADNLGTCPLSGMPCDPKQQTAVIKHTIEALKYGIEHGFIKSPFAVKVPDVPELVRYDVYSHKPMEASTSGLFVLASEAERIIEDQVKEIYFDKALGITYKSLCEMINEECEKRFKRAEAAEAKLAEIEKQVPIWYVIKHRHHMDSFQTYPLTEDDTYNGFSETPLYAHPVAGSEAETIERLKSALDRAEYGIDQVHKSLMSNGPKQASGEVAAFFLSEIRAMSGKELS